MFGVTSMKPTQTAAMWAHAFQNANDGYPQTPVDGAIRWRAWLWWSAAQELGLVLQ